MLRSLGRWLMPTAERRQAHQLYLSAVEASRNPYFYSELGIPDTLDGRFELILVHQFLLLERLKAEHGGVFDANESGFERELIEAMFDDLDRSLRELGVGDMGVSRRMKKMANAFYGRLSAYGEAEDDAALDDALNRNAFATVPLVPTGVIAGLRDYVRLVQQRLRNIPVEQIRDARIEWPSPQMA